MNSENEKRKRQSFSSRSHYSTMSDEISPAFQISADDVRQQSLSLSIREISHFPGSVGMIKDQDLSIPDEVDEQLGISHSSSESTPLLLPLSDEYGNRSPSFSNDSHESKSIIYALPAVLLATILNLLDAVSYGMIIFPTTSRSIPETAAASGISLFFVSTIVSQLVFTCGGSAFKGAVGSMMIEIMPFLQIICGIIEKSMDGSDSKAVLATMMCAYSMSCVMTGLVFLLFGVLKLGNFIQFFPRHILMGCIGGIGLFLMATGLEVTSGLKLELSMEFIKNIVKVEYFKIWGSSLIVAIVLKLCQISTKFGLHPLFIPVYYFSIPLLFYVIGFSTGYSVENLRDQGWLFDLKSSNPDQNVPFWEFWTYYNFGLVDWNTVLLTMPTQLALSFFGILHVPINIPALGVSLRQEVDLNREILSHGLSNVLSGFCGSCQNYLVYSNSLLYIRSGGDSRAAGLLLAIATSVLWILGGSIICFVPKIVVGALIFYLAAELLKESIYDTFTQGIHYLEYTTIILIVASMGLIGFTEGIILGIILSNVFFVVMYARRPVIRCLYTGSQLRSTVHRLYRQQKFLDKVGHQISIIKLQGFIFFGTINQLNEHTKIFLNGPAQIRFLILDFSLISGVDYSAMEAFQTIARKLIANATHMIFCGLESDTKKLVSSGLFDESETLVGIKLTHIFDNLNQALEWCENTLLSTYYQKVERAQKIPTRRARQSIFNRETPRNNETNFAASLVAKELPFFSTSNVPHPVSILLQGSTEGQYSDALYGMCASLFEQKIYLKGTVIWNIDDAAHDLIILESGELVIKMTDDGNDPIIVETMLPGTMVGELEFFSQKPRLFSLSCEKDSMVWSLSAENFDKAFRKNPSLMRHFMALSLSFDITRFYNISHHWRRIS